ESIESAELTEAYLYALTDQNMLGEKRAMIAQRATSSGNPKLLQQYARAVSQAGYGRDAQAGYAALIALNPQDSTAYREAGIAAFAQGDYSASARYLQSYFAQERVKPIYEPMDKEAYLAYYHYAEILRRNQDETAGEYYAATIDSI